MTDFMTPRGHLANLIADTASFEDFSVMASCPIPTGRMQLLPLRYGLVEKEGIPKPLPMPYELQSHTTGLRLLRNGYLYVIDSTTQLLHEYRIKHGSLTALLCKAPVVTEDVRSASVGEPLMIFADTGVLHICYAEIQWTARKCAQVLGSQEDREHFMQQVSLAGSDEFGPGEHMFSAQQVKRGLAEIAWGKTSQPRPAPPEGPEEFRPYAWEHTSLYRTTWLEELTSQVDNTQRNAYLFLAVRDDLGVMRDLAHHQDQIVGWGDALNEGGATPGQNLRDYMLGALIESQELISAESLAQLLKLAGGQPVQALLSNLEYQSEPDKLLIKELMLEYGKAENRPVRTPVVGGIQASRTPLPHTIEREHCRAFFKEAPQAFIEHHLEGLIQVGNLQNEHVRSVLNGSIVSGKRGINDLIDRPAMDAFLSVYRTQINRWDDKLRLITQDRVIMACRDNFHRSAWYFDPQQMPQIEAAFNCQNDCLKDLCRSDDACDMVLKLLEHRPLNDVPLAHTLALGEQAEMAARLAVFFNAGAVLVNNVSDVGSDYRGAIRAHLPVLSDLPEAARQLGKLAHDAFAPAISKAVDKALSLQGLIDGKVPTLAQMIGKLPKVFPGRLLGAIQQSGASFQIGTHQDAEAIGRYVQEVAARRAEIKALNHKRNVLNTSAGHKSAGSQALMAKIEELRPLLIKYENSWPAP